MISWNTKKRLLYSFFTILFLSLLIGVPLYVKFFVKPPSCFDQKLNQNELETDCGGICERICRSEVNNPEVLFYRFFEVAQGVYNAVALIENSNDSFYATRVPYQMKFYDVDNVLIAESIGETLLSSKKTFPIIEYTIATNERKITRMSFEFLGDIKWQRGVFEDPDIEILEKNLRDDRGVQKLQAKIKNNEVYKVRNIPLIALLYDENDNLVAASHTLVDEVPAKGYFPIVFTWAEAFKNIPTKIDIIPQLVPRELLK
jgi:hypothetical protein